jgi:hypothetical protein
MTITADGSIVDGTGKVLYFSLERFTRDICEGNCCFICGVAPAAAEFNNEHILPNWVLKKFGLHGRAITLPNLEQHQYGTYTVPCCKACNSLMADRYETPISELVAQGKEAIYSHLESEGPQLLFTWMALIFLKTHLKDRLLRKYLDRRLGDETIAADYQWEIFHHLHAVARAFYVNAIFDPSVFGALSCLPALTEEGMERFDLVDLSQGQTLMVRIDDIALYAVFDDACATHNGINDILERIKGPLNHVQLREVAAQYAACNLHLRNRPLFSMTVAPGDPIRVRLLATHDERALFYPRDPSVFGSLLERVNSHALDYMAPGRTRDEYLALMRSGKLSFLFDDQGAFIQYPLPSTQVAAAST